MKKNPFASIDQTGVGQLMQIAAQKGRKVKKDLKLGIGGEHGGDPASVTTVCHECEVGLSVTVPLAMRNVWSGALFDWRGIRINCPNKVRGCEVVEMLEAGDRAEIWGKAYWEVENTGWPRIVVDVFKVTQVERVTVIPGISYWWWVRQAAELQERIVSVLSV